jgi:hypothetical protein
VLAFVAIAALGWYGWTKYWEAPADDIPRPNFRRPPASAQLSTLPTSGALTAANTTTPGPAGGACPTTTPARRPQAPVTAPSPAPARRRHLCHQHAARSSTTTAFACPVARHPRQLMPPDSSSAGLTRPPPRDLGRPRARP